MLYKFKPLKWSNCGEYLETRVLDTVYRAFKSGSLTTVDYGRVQYKQHESQDAAVEAANENWASRFAVPVAAIEIPPLTWSHEYDDQWIATAVCGTFNVYGPSNARRWTYMPRQGTEFDKPCADVEEGKRLCQEYFLTAMQEEIMREQRQLIQTNIKAFAAGMRRIKSGEKNVTIEVKKPDGTTVTMKGNTYATG